MNLPISRTRNNADPQPWPDVEWLQTELLRRGYSVGPSGIDGEYGGHTELAVRRWQYKVGLAVDGVFGERSFVRMTGRITATELDAAWFADRALVRVLGQDSRPRPRYSFGHECRLTDEYPQAFDCSEMIEWAMYQAYGIDWVDGSYNQIGACRLIPVSQALSIKGALLGVTGNGRPSGVHHIAVSMGNGMTAEARSTAMGCGSWPAGRRFNIAGVVPRLRYPGA